MKKKAIVLMVLCVMGLTALSIGNAQAGVWYTCTISKAGSAFGSNYITVSEVNSAFTNRVYFLDNSGGQANSMLAEALTAFANSTNIEVYLEDITAFTLCFGVAAFK